MPATLEQVLAAAKQLTVQEQHELIDELIVSSSSPGEDELSAEWKAELDRRTQCIANGTAKLVPWEEVKQRLESKAARREHD